MGPSSERNSPLIKSLSVASVGPINNPTKANEVIIKKKLMYEISNLTYFLIACNDSCKNSTASTILGPGACKNNVTSPSTI